MILRILYAALIFISIFEQDAYGMAEKKIHTHSGKKQSLDQRIKQLSLQPWIKDFSVLNDAAQDDENFKLDDFFKNRKIMNIEIMQEEVNIVPKISQIMQSFESKDNKNQKKIYNDLAQNVIKNMQGSTNEEKALRLFAFSNSIGYNNIEPMILLCIKNNCVSLPPELKQKYNKDFVYNINDLHDKKDRYDSESREIIFDLFPKKIKSKRLVTSNYADAKIIKKIITDIYNKENILDKNKKLFYQTFFDEGDFFSWNFFSMPEIPHRLGLRDSTYEKEIFEQEFKQSEKNYKLFERKLPQLTSKIKLDAYLTLHDALHSTMKKIEERRNSENSLKFSLLFYYIPISILGMIQYCILKAPTLKLGDKLGFSSCIGASYIFVNILATLIFEYDVSYPLDNAKNISKVVLGFPFFVPYYLAWMKKQTPTNQKLIDLNKRLMAKIKKDFSNDFESFYEKA